MDDLRNFALELLETEKHYLLEDKGEYFAAIVVVVTPDARYFEEVEFDDEEEGPLPTPEWWREHVSRTRLP